MTAAEAKQKLLEIGHEQAVKNRYRRAAISHAEMIATIKAAGWTEEPGGQESPFWKDPLGVIGSPVEPETACAVIWRREKDRQTTRTMENGELVRDCNQCGADCRKYHDGRCVGYYGLIGAEVGGGYFSDDLTDCTTYRFNLCEKCLAEMFGKWKHLPAIEVW